LPTITDVARRAGVAPVTVSRVINKAPHVNAATRQRVEEAIRELGYVPNVVARSLRSKRTRSLALLVPDITNTFWTTVARGVEDAAQSRGYSVLLCNTDENLAKQLRYLDLVVSQRVDGVIIAPCDAQLANLAALRDHGIATVIVDRWVEGWEGDTVRGDSLSGAYALVRHLITLGHRQIAIISGPANASTAEDRVAGYCLALAEAGITPDPRLIRRGEYRATSGEQLTRQLFDEGLRPTAIFAANNAIAMGVIDAIRARGLFIPQDIALVCFDDLANASHLYPFLTVAVQPAYEMGTNAAQLLLSRLESEVPLQPRHVVLPVRLIIRHSCGSQLHRNGHVPLSLPIPDANDFQNILVKPLAIQEREPCLAIPGITVAMVRRATRASDYDKSDINRLLKAFRHEEADRIPHLEFWVTSKSVFEYVLERELHYEIADASDGRQTIAPEDHIEFAQRLGMDAVPCHFSWRPGNLFARASDGSEHYVGGRIKSWSDLQDLDPPPPLASQLNRLECYLRAAQGTGVGVFPNFTSFFDSALLAIGLNDALQMILENRPFVERLMDILLEHQEQVMRAVCDRFGDDLPFIAVNDDIAYRTGLLIRPELFMEIFPQRMARLIAPAREHGKLLAFHSDGRLDQVLPLIYELGFRVVHPVEPEANDIFQLKAAWAGKLAFVGNISTTLLAYGSREEIEEKVREYCLRLGPGGGYVVGSSSSIMEGIPPENFVAMTQAVHRYGRYPALGQP